MSLPIIGQYSLLQSDTSGCEIIRQFRFSVIADFLCRPCGRFGVANAISGRCVRIYAYARICGAEHLAAGSYK